MRFIPKIHQETIVSGIDPDGLQWKVGKVRCPNESLGCDWLRGDKQPYQVTKIIGPGTTCQAYIERHWLASVESIRTKVGLALFEYM